MNAPVTAPESQALAVASRPGQFDLSPQTFEQALTFANYLADSDMVPKDFKGKPANCLIGMQWGMELGMKPLQAIQNIAVINGRPNLWGDAMLALVRSSPLCEYVTEDWHPDGTAYCKAKRRGEPEQVRTFSDADAKLAGLLGKQGPWTTGPKRMKQLRARGFALRDVFTDVLRGMGMAEEALDTVTMTEPRNMGMAEVVKPDLPFYTDEEFAKNMVIWTKVIKKGTKDVPGVLATVATMYQLTEAQAEAIKAIPAELMKEAKQDASGPTEITVMQSLERAKNIDDLNAAADLINSLTDEGAVKRLNSVYDNRAKELN